MSSRFIMPFADVGRGITPSSGAKLFFYADDGVTLKDTYSDQLSTPTPNSNPVIADSAGVFGDIYLSGSYKVTLTDNNGTQIFGGAVVEESAVGNLTSSLINDLSQAYTFATVAEMQSSTIAFPIGKALNTSKYNAVVSQSWEVVASGVGDLTDRTLPLASGLFAKMITGFHNVLSYGAYGDDTTDDKPFFDLAKIGSGNALIIPVPPIRYSLSNGLDWSSTTVMGASKQECKLRFSAAQTDCIISTGDTVISNLHLDGRWDGATAAQTGDLVRVDSASFIGEFHMSHCTLINAKQDSISLSNLGYSSLTDIRSQVTGRIGLHLDGSGSKTNTSLSLYGKNRFSDCPNGFGIRVEEAHNCDFSGAVCEYTAGIEIAGSANRSLCFNSVYQEFGSFPAAYTFTGSGDGLTITNNFGGGKTIPNTANFIDVTMFGNSNFSSIAPIQVNNLIVAEGGGTTPAITGQTTVNVANTASAVPAGLYRVSATLQTEIAVAGGVNSVSLLATINNADSAYQTSTGSLVELTDSDFSASQTSRLSIYGLISLSAPTTLYLKFGHDQTSGQMAFIGKMTLERVN